MAKAPTTDVKETKKPAPVKHEQPTTGGTFTRNPDTGELTQTSAPTKPRAPKPRV